MRLALFLLLALTLRAQIPGTTTIYQPFAPPVTNSTVFGLETIYIKGGTWTGVGDASWLTDTNRYPLERRDAGQLAILTDQTIYQLGPDLSTWAPLSLGGGGSITNLTGASLYGETYIENAKADTGTFKNGLHLSFDQMDAFKAGQVDNASSQLFMVQQTPLVVTNVATLLATPRPARGRMAWVQTGEWKGWWQFCPDETAADNGTTIRRPTSIVTDGEAARWVYTGVANYAQGLASNLGLTGLQNLTLYPLVQRTGGQVVTLTNGVVLQLASDLTTWNTRTFGDSVTSITGNAGTATKLQTARTIGMTGDVTWSSGLFDGSGNVTGAATLANANATPGTFGGSDKSFILGVDAKGRITALVEAGITAPQLLTARTIGMTGDLTWTSGAFNGTANVTGVGALATVNANVGTFGSSTLIPVITANAKGLVTAVTTVTAAGGGGAAYDPYIYKSSVPVQILNTITETSIFPAGAVTIPSGTLTTEGEMLHVLIPFKFLNNSGVSRTLNYKFKVGGVTVFDDSTATFPTGTTYRVGSVRVNIQRRGALLAAGGIEVVMSSTTTTTAGLGDFAVAPTFSLGGFEAATWDWSAGVPIDVTVTFPNATATIEYDTYGASIRR